MQRLYYAVLIASGSMLIFVVACFFFLWKEGRYTQKIILIQTTYLQVQEAKTPWQRSRGLAGRKSLAANQAMLFVFSKEKPLSFWMQGMLFPIDILWVDKSCRIVYLMENLPPCQEREGACPVYTAPIPAQYVLETTPYFARKHHLAVGKTIRVSDTCEQ